MGMPEFAADLLRRSPQSAQPAPTPAKERREVGWLPGHHVGRYQILRVLGEGTFGRTVLASREGPEASRFKKLVALKIMKAEHAQDEEFTKRMMDEAKLQAALHHDQLVDVYDFHVMAGSFVLEMEYVDGLTLSEYLQTFSARKVPKDVACFLASRLLRGLAWMHEACDEEQRALNLVHRDIKPSNIFLSRSGAIKLGDFGLISGRDRHFQTALVTDARLIGTPRYMAAEQCEDVAVDGRADVYAVGVMLYEMLTGGKHPVAQHLFAHDLEALAGTLSTERTPLRHHVPDLCPQLAKLVDAMVARQLEHRPTAMAALLALLEVAPVDIAKQELALQRGVTMELQRRHAHSSAYPLTPADEPTAYVHNPLLESSGLLEGPTVVAQPRARGASENVSAPVRLLARKRLHRAYAALIASVLFMAIVVLLWVFRS
jgi:serine/threonine-protein kinase